MSQSWCALATYAAIQGPRPALVVDDRLYDLDAVLMRSDVSTLVRDELSSVGRALGRWSLVASALPKLVAVVGEGHVEALNNPKIVAPYRPGRIFAAGANYDDHAQEMAKVMATAASASSTASAPAAPRPEEPYFFPKANTAVIGPGDTVIKPARVTKLDGEVELAVIIGQGGRNIALGDALQHVAAYTIMNDVSARDQNTRTDFPFKQDWLRGKSWDTFAPLGPWVVPAACIGDPQALKLGLKLNGEVMQDGVTGSMIFSVAEQIAFLSMVLTLEPGDLIATGTPSGVGMGRGVFMKSGDVMHAWIEKIGALENPVK